MIIKFKNGYIGFEYEIIENHVWTKKSLQYRAVSTANYENQLLNEFHTKESWPETKSFRWYYAPDGDPNHRLYTDTISAAVRLLNTEWKLVEPENPPGGYVIVTGSLDGGIGDVMGPFSDSQTAGYYATKVVTDQEDFSIQPLTVPDCSVMET